MFRREELDADPDVRAGPPAAAQLVGTVLQPGARELHRPDALVALAELAVLEVLPVPRLRDLEVGRRAGRALDRVVDRVVPEHVGEVRLLLDHGADQRHGHARPPGLARR